MMHTCEMTGRPGMTWISKVANQFSVYKYCISILLNFFFCKTLCAHSLACKNKSGNHLKDPKNAAEDNRICIKRSTHGFVVSGLLLFQLAGVMWRNKNHEHVAAFSPSAQIPQPFFVMVLFNGNNQRVFSVGFCNDHPSTSRQVSLINTRCTLRSITEHLLICYCWCCILTTMRITAEGQIAHFALISQCILCLFLLVCQ